MTAAIDWRSHIMTIAAEHPALPGHFPGRPVVPGVVILDCVRSALAQQHNHWRLAGMPSVKFMRPLLPQQAFCIQLQGEPPRLRFTVEDDAGTRLVQGQLSIEVAGA